MCMFASDCPTFLPYYLLTRICHLCSDDLGLYSVVLFRIFHLNFVRLDHQRSDTGGAPIASSVYIR